ncbi:MAG: hypothetical protein LBD28_06320 [Tannerellaceae bacterium]|jgi:hypothetical protein|nr:hypothetical protein [Tannerellaceae bacterium]
MANKKHRTKRVSLFTIFRGEGFEMIAEHSRMILLITILTVFFIGNRYSCDLKRKQIDQLKKELAEAKLQAKLQAVELIRYGSRAELEERLRRKGSALTVAQLPPYILYK